MEDQENKIVTINEILSKNVRLIRAAAGLTGEQFSEHVGIARNHLFNLEKGAAKYVMLDFINNMYEKYNADLNQLFKHNMSHKMLTNKTLGGHIYYGK